MKILPLLTAKFFRKIFPSLFLGFFIIFLHIFIRFFIERIPHYINSNTILISLFLAFFLIILHSYIIINICYRFYLKKITQPTFFHSIKNTYYIKPLLYFHDYIIVNIPYSGYFLEDINKLYQQYCRTNLTRFLSIILFDFAPRILISIAFIIDIFIYQQFAYLYILLPLLIIPITFPGIIYILLNFGKRNRKICEKYLNISVNKKGNLLFNLKPKYDQNLDLLILYSDHWTLYNNIETFFKTIFSLRERYLSYIIIFTSLSYICCWSYYICIVLKNPIIQIKLYQLFTFYTLIEEPFSGLFL